MHATLFPATWKASKYYQKTGTHLSRVAVLSFSFTAVMCHAASLDRILSFNKKINMAKSH